MAQFRNDIYDEKYGSQNMKTNLRYPERSFGPGIVNDSNKVIQEFIAKCEEIVKHL